MAFVYFLVYVLSFHFRTYWDPFLLSAESVHELWNGNKFSFSMDELLFFWFVPILIAYVDFIVV